MQPSNRVETSGGIFVGGCDRSGTTLLQAMLCAHSQLWITYETVLATRLHGQFARLGPADIDAFATAALDAPQFKDLSVRELRAALAVPALTFSKAVSITYTLLAQTKGKSIWGDKNPGYARRMDFLADRFPEARFLHIHRNPYTVIPSVIRQSWGPDTAFHAALMWREYVGKAVDSVRRLGRERAMHVVYEDFVTRTESQVAEICRFLGVQPEPAMLDPASRRASVPVSKADIHPKIDAAVTLDSPDPRKHLTDGEIEIIDRVCGELMEELGYPQLTALAGQGVPLGGRVRYGLLAKYRAMRKKLRKSMP